MLDTITQESVIRLATQQTRPAPPQVVMRLLQVLRGDEFSLADVVAVVESDVSSAAAVMAAANSVANRGVSPARSVRDAVMRLGMSATRDRVMHQAMQSAFQPRHPALTGLLGKEWALAAAVATMLRRVADPEFGFDDPDAAFTIGLFHNIGMVPLLSAAPALIDIGSASGYYSAARHHASALGGALARRWHLGDAVYKTALHCLRPAAEPWGPWILVGIARQLCAEQLGHQVACDAESLERSIVLAQRALDRTDVIGWLQAQGAYAA